MTTSKAQLADELDYWIGVIGDRIGRDGRRFSETATEAAAALRWPPEPSEGAKRRAANLARIRAVRP